MDITPPNSIASLNRIALTIRRRSVETSASARIPHLGSCLSCIELLVTLYWQELRINPKEPEAPDRDRFLLIKGHAAPCFFRFLRNVAFLIERLAEFGQPGERISRASPQTWLCSWRRSSGSLGHGLPMAHWQSLNASKKVTAAATPS